ncbi:MAG: hypothetical protein ACXWZ4_13640 [Gemmatirosa sp.]
MADSVVRPDAGLAELLTLRARSATPRRLALDVVGGLLAAVLVAIWQPVAWPALLAAALCFASYGAWAAADRGLAPAKARARAELRVPPPVLEPTLWRSARAVSAAVGVASAVALVYSTLFGVIGRWIS